jgi:hypothetical protein
VQFNPGDGSGLVDEINDICHSDNQSYPLASKARRLNAAVDRYVTIAMEVNENFHFDDTNNTTLPIGTSDIKSGQGNVPFPIDFLAVRNIFIKDNNGKYSEIFEEKDPARYAFFGGRSGRPTAFRLMGGSIVWDYVPDYTQEDGVLIHFTRNAQRVSPNDTIFAPGIPLIFHPWLAQHASLPYLIEQQKANKGDIGNKVLEGEAAIRYHLSNKNKTRVPRLGISQKDSNK